MTAGVFPAGGNPLGGVAGFARDGAGRTGIVTGREVAAGNLGVVDVVDVDGVGVGVGVAVGAGGRGFAPVWADASDAARLDRVNADRADEKKMKETAVPRRTHFRFVEESGTICNDVGMIELKKRSHRGAPWSSVAQAFDLHCQPIRHPSPAQTNDP